MIKKVHVRSLGKGQMYNKLCQDKDYPRQGKKEGNILIATLISLKNQLRVDWRAMPTLLLEPYINTIISENIIETSQKLKLHPPPASDCPLNMHPREILAVKSTRCPQSQYYDQKLETTLTSTAKRVSKSTRWGFFPEQEEHGPCPCSGSQPPPLS